MEIEQSYIRPRKRRRWGLIFFFVLVVLPLTGAALYTWGTLKFVYARGERAGYLQKFSQKGWVCKTWEGELAMVNLPGQIPEIFHFTVRDRNVASHLSEVIGQRVTIYYEQHKGVPTTCFGDTMYYVVDVKRIS